MNFKILIFLFLSSIGSAFCQKRANVWHFGPDGAGLDFNTCPPTVLTNGWVDIYWGLFEGSTSICDTNGQLLFYSNGTSVFNANNVYMQNGNAVLGANTNTMCQNVIIPKPGSSTVYYLFSPMVQAFQGNFGVAYSVIDMALAGGLGAVVSYGNILRDTIGRRTSEKLTSIMHANGQDVWLVGHDYFNNKFFAYRISVSGINSVSVESSVGPALTDPVNQSHFDAIGELKASPDGTKLAFTSYGTGVTAAFNFDKFTGQVSNPVSIDVSNHSSQTNGYGVSFSPNNSKLYVSVAILDSSSQLLGNLNQFDLSVWDSLSIGVSRKIFPTSLLYSLKLGPDKRIYAGKATGATYLGVINFPDSGGSACNYVNNGFYLNGLQATWGLNNAIEMFDECNALFVRDVDAPHVKIYPNPASSVLVIDSHHEIREAKILNDLGEIVYGKRIEQTKFLVSIAELSPGFYTLQLDMTRVKFVKE